MHTSTISITSMLIFTYTHLELHMETTISSISSGSWKSYASSCLAVPSRAVLHVD